MGARIRLVGAEQVLANFQRIDNRIKRQTIGDALSESGEYVRKDVHDKTPVKGGSSADGFYVSKAWSHDPSKAGAVRKSVKWALSTLGNAVVIYTKHIIAPKLEYGTSRESPHPFFRRSYDDKDTRNGIKDIFTKHIRGAIR